MCLRIALQRYEDVRGEAFQTLIDENKDIVLVDVRPAKQVQEEGMIEGANNVPFDEVEGHLDQLPKGKTIALSFSDKDCHLKEWEGQSKMSKWEMNVGWR